MDKPTKKRINAAIVLLAFIMLPIIAFEVRDLIKYRNYAGDQVVNNFPAVSEKPETNAYAGELYASKIIATDKDQDVLIYLLNCPAEVTDSKGVVRTHEECENVQPVYPAGLQLNRETGDISWDVPLDAAAENPIKIYVTDGIDYVVYETMISVSTREGFVVKNFSVTPSSGNIILGYPVTFSATIESTTGVTKVTAEIFAENELIDTLTWEFTNPQTLVLIDENSEPPFTFTPTIQNVYSVDLTVVTANGEESLIDNIINFIVRPVHASGGTIVLTPAGNSAPVFQNNPTANNANIINQGQTYQFTLNVADPDGDVISCTAIAPEGSSGRKWVTITETPSSNGSQIAISLTGSTNEEGSYMITITCNDGYPIHYVTRVWPVIVQRTEGNDTPVVVIASPTSPVVMTSTQTLRINWTGTNDRNQIIRYSLYYTTNPANSSTWVKIVDLNHNFVEYNWTPNLPTGTYYVIVQATDDQVPAGIGYLVTPQISVTNVSQGGGTGAINPSQPPEDNTPPVEGNTVTNPENTYFPPEITNIIPLNGSTIVKTEVTLQADLNAGNNNIIDRDSLVVLLDDKDISDLIILNQRTDQKASFTYVAKNLTEGQHSVKVSFENDKTEKAEKNWNFSIKLATTTESEKETSSDTITLFGIEFPKNLLIIIAIGIAFLLLGLLFLPFLFGRDKTTKYISTTTYQPINPPTTQSTSSLTSQSSSPPTKTSTYIYQEPNNVATISSPSGFYQSSEPATITTTSTATTTQPTTGTPTTLSSQTPKQSNTTPVSGLPPDGMITPPPVTSSTLTTTTTSSTGSSQPLSSNQTPNGNEPKNDEPPISIPV
ncbi:hypothetical protein JW962_03650 [Candidatus Dojkabacteria bacterium]|nr:hypothetical protein [Candidatus Dojkabacteria bacterium]